MDESFSRRTLLRTAAGATAATGLATPPALAAGSEDGRDGVDADGVTQVDATGRPSDELPGFVRTWEQSHVESGETKVSETAASLGDGDAVVVGETSSDGSLAEQRIWVGEFDESGARWTTTLRADGPSDAPRLLVADDHYLVFWDGTIDDEDAKRVTKVAPDGNIRFQRTLSFGFGGFVDVVATDDGYLGLTPDTLWKFDDAFESVASTDLPDPIDDLVGWGADSIVPVDGGYVVTGTVIPEDGTQAFWAVKLTDAGGTVRWSNAYTFDENVFAGVGAALDDGGVAIVGAYGGDANDPVALAVGPDGERRWTRTPSVPGIADYADVLVDDVGVRALGSFDGRVAVATYDAEGEPLGRWREAEAGHERFGVSFDAHGDGRFVVGAIRPEAERGAATDVVGLKRNERPDPSVSVSPSDPVAGQAVTFDASETTDTDTSVEAVEWDLDGDGTFEESGETVTARFDEPGSREVTVRAVDAVGAAAEATVSVSVAENTAPTASVSASADTATVGEDVTFEATDVGDAETAIGSTVWYRGGDERVGTGESVTLSFDSPGEYEVVLVVADTTGRETRASTTVTVVEPTTATDATGGDGAGGPTPGFGVGSTVAAVTAGAGVLARRLRRDDGD